MIACFRAVYDHNLPQTEESLDNLFLNDCLNEEKVSKDSNFKFVLSAEGFFIFESLVSLVQSLTLKRPNSRGKNRKP